MKYVSTLISVVNMEISKRFYHDVLGLNVISDLGANVTLTGGFALQRMDTWRYFIENKDVNLHNNAVELVFEEKEMDKFLDHLKKFDIEYVHDIVEHSWGQRVIRFYDPDYHIIEVGEDMEMVVKRFKDSGMTEEQVAERMNVPLEYVQGYLNS
ncbi:MAG: glyoxalase [Lachnospiraceae bacterium]|nr:glyoxalase [Lachnospiraceae bacterium]